MRQEVQGEMVVVVENKSAKMGSMWLEIIRQSVGYYVAVIDSEGSKWLR